MRRLFVLRRWRAPLRGGALHCAAHLTIVAAACKRRILESKEIPMSWNKWIRQTHRWLSIIMTAAIIFNFVEVLGGKYARWMGLLAVVPFALQMITGLYLFVLPYAARRRGGAHAD
jgi:hypothetical protein